ncbi:MAG: 2-dehydropantoate 2-reductase [Polyangiaceae bacterium]
MQPRILIVGCGAIGGVLAGALLEIGQDVSVLTTNDAIASAVAEHGVRVSTADGAIALPPTRVLREPDASAQFDYVLLATQPPQVEAAAASALGMLAPEGKLVCFQNGLCEERVAKLTEPGRVLGAVVAWGASVIEPGVYERTSSGSFTLGRYEGGLDEATEELGRLLEAIGPVTLTDNLRGARWSKLAINAAISTLGTIGGDRLGPLMRHRHVRRLALEIMTETVRVAQAEGVQLEKVSGTLDLNWIALTEAEQSAAGSPGLLAKHTLLLAVGARYRRLRSSMLAAIERGRPPAVDFLNGEILDRAKQHRLRAPINQAARDLVWAIARGEATPSHALVRKLYDDTR